MDRRDKALQFVNLAGRGLEIGPSYSPLVAKASGARVETVDHADRDTLVAKYREYGLDSAMLACIEPVDHVWSGGSLLDVVPHAGTYDYVVASHFIEHTVDLIGFLRDCQSLLRPDGVLALVVPDKRYCFDRFQPLSTVGDVVDACNDGDRFHPAGSLLDHQAYACRRADAIAWAAADEAPYELQFPQLEGAAAAIEAGLRQGEYSDIHRWKFTPASFDLLIRDLGALGYHDMGVVGALGTDGFEFFVSLGTGAGSTAIDRLGALLEVERELAEPTLSCEPTERRDGSADLQLRVVALEAAMREMRSSRSWRITGPLRKASELLRRVRSGKSSKDPRG
ncbi:MAG: class I SAM-dependent methyltransferase [Acidimicrobiales bacterium]